VRCGARDGRSGGRACGAACAPRETENSKRAGFAFWARRRRGGDARALAPPRRADARACPRCVAAQLAGVRVNLVAKPRVAAKVSARSVFQLYSCARRLPSLRALAAARGLLRAGCPEAGARLAATPRACARRAARRAAGEAQARVARIIFSRPNQLWVGCHDGSGAAVGPPARRRRACRRGGWCCAGVARRAGPRGGRTGAQPRRPESSFWAFAASFSGFLHPRASLLLLTRRPRLPPVSARHRRPRPRPCARRCRSPWARRRPPSPWLPCSPPRFPPPRRPRR
jgi:hypothetical protein